MSDRSLRFGERVCGVSSVYLIYAGLFSCGASQVTDAHRARSSVGKQLVLHSRVAPRCRQQRPLQFFAMSRPAATPGRSLSFKVVS